MISHSSLKYSMPFLWRRPEQAWQDCGLRLYSDGLPFGDYKKEVLDSLQSIPSHSWAVAKKDKLSN